MSFSNAMSLKSASRRYFPGTALPFFFCMVIFSFSLPLFAKGGPMSGAGKLSVIRTQYFDIIYPEECRRGAEKIAGLADGYYEEIAALFETDCKIRFPVSITKSVETTNGYFTVAPYNAIVLQYTPPEISLDQNSDSLAAVFYHELTHAVSTNIKNGFSRFVSAVFGDWFAPAGFLETSFMHEGTAVSFESLKGEGRVHDPYSRLLVVQAKLDGRFPDWRDVTGARDIFPGGTDAYAFGALFCHYLQERYGMEKYALFWKTTGSLHGFKSSIKRTYGKPLSEIWDDFEEWVSLPQVTEVPSAEHGVGDFFVDFGLEKARDDGFSRSNSRRQVFKCIASSAYGLAWFETKTGGVWYGEMKEGSLQKPRKLFTCPAVSRLSLSPDGAWLLLSYLQTDRTTKARLALYNIKRKKLRALSLPSVRDAAFVRGEDGSLQIACVSIAGDKPSLEVYALDGERGLLQKKPLPEKRFVFKEDEQPFSPALAADGGLACIVKKGMNWHIRLYENDSVYREYGSEKTIIHNLQSMYLPDGRLALAFSYAESGDKPVLPRAGMLAVDMASYESTLVLQDDDVSGGVLNAVLLPGDREKFLYVSAFYDKQRLMLMDFAGRKVIRHSEDAPERLAVEKETPAGEPAVAGDLPLTGERSAGEPVVTEPLTAGERISYNPFRYYRRNLRIPIGLVKSYRRNDLDTYTFGYTNLGTAFLGATAASSTPWQDGIVALSGGWNPFDKNGGACFSVTGGNDTFKYNVNGNLLFDGYGFMQTTEGISLSKTLYSRFGKSFSGGASGVYFYGHGKHGEADDWSARTRGYLQFSTVRKMSPRYADSAGITLQPFILWERISSHYVNAGFTAGLRIPGLFPLSLSASLFPSTTFFASASASIYLFSLEVQKGIPLALYIDRIYLTATYSGKFSYKADTYFDISRTADIARNLSKNDYSDLVQLRLAGVASVNAGVLSRLTFDAGIAFQYRPNPRANEKKIAVGVNAVLVY
ncbi:MAG: hypothetical protein IKS40_03815 [Treponema sp.]|nr:hypothetical protein [Treponema sp.]